MKEKTLSVSELRSNLTKVLKLINKLHKPFTITRRGKPEAVIMEAGECFVFFGKVSYAAVDDAYFKGGLWSKVSELPLHLGGNKMVYAG